MNNKNTEFIIGIELYMEKKIRIYIWQKIKEK